MVYGGARLAPRESASSTLRASINKLNKAARLSTIIAVFVGAHGCAGTQSALAPRGPAADQIAGLWWFMFGSALAVYVVVLALIVAAIGRRNREKSSADMDRSRWFLRAGLIIPPIVLAAVFMASERASGVLHAQHERDDVVVRVKGWQWWWEVTYVGSKRDQDVVTANEIHIPVGRRVRLELTTGDVIHSFWVPNLQGKVDQVPGRTNVLWLEAERPGVSRGQCAEYCGTQHTHMALRVVAEPPDAFAAWLANERRSAVISSDSLSQRGLGLFGQAGCAYCHAIRGTNSLGKYGPDLTHLASRHTIGAGAADNTAENLATWIAEAQRIKPGNRMPNVPLDAEQRRAIVHFLMQLR